MKMKSKHLFTTLALLAAALFTACQSSEKPDYQGRSGSTPKIDDYYPSNTNTNTNGNLR